MSENVENAKDAQEAKSGAGNEARSSAWKSIPSKGKKPQKQRKPASSVRKSTHSAKAVADEQANASGNNSRRRGGSGTQRNSRDNVPQKGEHILFVGFMGCGKSSVSRILAKRTGLPLIDVDKYIEKTQGRTIKQIFAEEGESGFRRIETQAMAALAQEPKSIISCGGGVCGSIVNRAIVKSLGTVIYLKVPLNEAISRISDPSTRPMLSRPRPVREIYDERLPLYRDVADITINTSGKSVGANVAQCVGALRRKGLL